MAANAMYSSPSADPMAAALQKKLAMLNNTVAPDSTVAEQTASSTATSAAPSKVRDVAPTDLSGQPSTPFASTPSSAPAPGFSLSDQQKADMQRSIADTAARNAKARDVAPTDIGRYTPPPAPARTQPGFTPKGPAAPIKTGAGSQLAGIVGGVGDVAGGIRRDVLPTVQEIRDSSPTEAAGHALGGASLALPVGEIAGAIGRPIAGAIGDFAGRAFGGIGGAIRSRLGGLGGSVAEDAASNALRSSTLPLDQEQIAARLGTVTPAQQATADRLAADVAARSGQNALTEASTRANALGTGDGLGLTSDELRQALIGQRGAPLGRRLATSAANSGLAEDAARYSGSPIGDAIDNLVGRLPGPVKAGAAAAGIAGLVGSQVPGVTAQPGAASTPSDINQHNPQSPITDAAIAAQNAGSATPPPPPPPGGSTAPTTTVGGGLRPVTTVPGTTPGTTTQPPGTVQSALDAMTRGINNQKGGATTTTGGVGGAGGGAAGGGTTSLPGGGGGGGLGSSEIQQQLQSDLQGISEQLSTGPQTPDVMALFVSQGSKLIELINQQEQELRAEAAKDGSTIDPATQNTLDTMRQELDRQIKAQTETLNSRGLLDSGILAQVQIDMRKGNMSDQAKILGERLSRIQQNLQNSVQSLRSQKIATAGQFGLAGAQAQTQAEAAERNRMDTLRGQLIAGRTGLLNNATQVEEAQRGRDFTAEQNGLQRQLAIAQTQADIAARSGDAEAQRQWQGQQNDLERQLKQSMQDQAIGAGQYSGGGSQPTPTTVDLATNTFIVQLDQAPDRDSAIAAFNAALSDGTFNSAHADPAKILAAINQKFPQNGGFFGIGQ